MPMSMTRRGAIVSAALLSIAVIVVSVLIAAALPSIVAIVVSVLMVAPRKRRKIITRYLLLLRTSH